MPALSVQRSRYPNQQKLPDNADEVIGFGPSIVIDYFATLGSFFKTALYGPVDSWSKFWQSVGFGASSMYDQDRLGLYDSIKGPSSQLIIGHKFTSEQEAEKAKDPNKQQRTYKVLPTSMSEKNLAEILRVLPASKSDADVMISLQKLARDPRISREVRVQINQKLNAAKRNVRYIQYIPENPNYYRYLLAKRAAMIIGVAIILGVGIANILNAQGVIDPDDQPIPPLPSPVLLDESPLTQAYEWQLNQTEKAMLDAQQIENRTTIFVGNVFNKFVEAAESLIDQEDRIAQNLHNMTLETPQWLIDGFDEVKQGCINLWADFDVGADKAIENARTVPEQIVLLLPSPPPNLFEFKI